MLKIQDDQGKDLFVIKDDATEPEIVGKVKNKTDEKVEEPSEEKETK